jgi:hypothetical protein
VGQRILMMCQKDLRWPTEQFFQSQDPIVRRFIDGVSDPKEIQF